MRKLTVAILLVIFSVAPLAGCKKKDPEPPHHKMTRPKLPEMPKQ